MIVVMLVILTGCSAKPKGPTYSSPYELKVTPLRTMVANPTNYIGGKTPFYIGPLYVVTNDLTRKMLTVSPLTENEEIDTDVEIEVTYGSLGNQSDLIQTYKGDVIYVRGYMNKYSNTNNYYFRADVIHEAVVNK